MRDRSIVLILQQIIYFTIHDIYNTYSRFNTKEQSIKKNTVWSIITISRKQHLYLLEVDLNRFSIETLFEYVHSLLNKCMQVIEKDIITSCNNSFTQVFFIFKPITFDFALNYCPKLLNWIEY